MKWTLTRRGDNRGWPNYIFGGRVRTSTAGLLLAFVALFWVNQTHQPPPSSQEPAQQVVPPGFVPDPAYTWVPRTNVAPRDDQTTTTTTTTTTPTPTTTIPTTTSPTSPVTTSSTPGLPGVPGLPGAPATTTVIDPDGPGPQAPETFTQAPPALTPTSVPAPVPVPGLFGQPR
jgi:cytoskeletal protein RodZ